MFFNPHQVPVSSFFPSSKKKMQVAGLGFLSLASVTGLGFWTLHQHQLHQQYEQAQTQRRIQEAHASIQADVSLLRELKQRSDAFYNQDPKERVAKHRQDLLAAAPEIESSAWYSGLGLAIGAATYLIICFTPRCTGGGGGTTMVINRKS